MKTFLAIFSAASVAISSSLLLPPAAETLAAELGIRGGIEILSDDVNSSTRLFARTFIRSGSAGYAKLASVKDPSCRGQVGGFAVLSPSLLVQMAEEPFFARHSPWVALTKENPFQTRADQRLYFFHPDTFELREMYLAAERKEKTRALGRLTTTKGGDTLWESAVDVEPFKRRRGNMEGAELRVFVETKKPFEIVKSELSFFVSRRSKSKS